MFIFRMAIVLACPGFQDVRRRFSSVRNAPALAVEAKRSFWLRAGQTELSGIVIGTSGPGIRSQAAQPVRDVGLGQQVLIASAPGSISKRSISNACLPKNWAGAEATVAPPQSR